MAITNKVSELPATTGLQLNDVIVLNRNGAFTKGSTFTQIQDANGNELFKFTAVANAINEITNSNNSTGLDPILSATGNDADIGLTLLTKGTGAISLKSANTTSPLRILSGTGLQHTSIFSFANTANSRTITFPDETFTVAGATTAGTSGQLLQSTGTAGGIHTWTTPTYPGSSGTARKILVSDGTNNVYSTETYAVPGSQYNILQSDGTNWAAATPTGTGLPVCATSPTLTTPRIGSIYDAGGAPSIAPETVASGVNYLGVVGSASGGGTVNLYARGTDTNIGWGINAKGSSGVYINNGNGTAAQFSSPASAVNYLLHQSAATAGSPIISAVGSDTNVGLTLQSKGSSSILLQNDLGGPIFVGSFAAGTIANYAQFVSNTAGQDVLLQFVGSDTNVSGRIRCQAAGSIYLTSTTLANYLKYTPAATGNNSTLSVEGDANQSLVINGAGTGGVIIEGTGTNDSAAAGYVGEFITSNIASGSAGSCTTATARNVTSISLTAGDWDVWGNVTWIPAATTSVSWLRCWISTTSATMPNPDLFSGWANVAAGVVPNVTGLGQTAPIVRISVSSTTTVYLSCNQTFGVSTCTSCGTISARRVR